MSDELEVVDGELDFFLLSSCRGTPSPMANAVRNMKDSAAKPHFVHFRGVNFYFPSLVTFRYPQPAPYGRLLEARFCRRLLGMSLVAPAREMRRVPTIINNCLPAVSN